MNIAEALPVEQARVRELVAVYDAIPTGFFGGTMLRRALANAERAAASGDVVAMLRSYKELKDCQ